MSSISLKTFSFDESYCELNHALWHTVNLHMYCIILRTNLCAVSCGELIHVLYHTMNLLI